MTAPVLDGDSSASVSVRQDAHAVPWIVTIDGVAGSGKSTAARACARGIGYDWMSTGKLYRVAGVLAHRRGILCSSLSYPWGKEVSQRLVELGRGLQESVRFEWGAVKKRVYWQDQEVSGWIDDEDAGKWAALVGQDPLFRQSILPWQHHLATTSSYPGVVFDGRDLGTVVFAQSALCKFFLVADEHCRARRRWTQQHPDQEPSEEELARLTKQLRERDHMDVERSAAPLLPAKDAVIINTSSMSVMEMTDRLCEHIRACIADRQKS